METERCESSICVCLHVFVFVMSRPGVPEPPRRAVDDRGTLSHLSSAAPLLCHGTGRGRVVRNPGEPGGASPTVSGNLTVCASHNLLCAPLRRAQLFRRALVRMFESQDLDCVFMELHINPRQRRHMVLECVPLPRELGDMAPIYYKVSRRAASSPSDDVAPSSCNAAVCVVALRKPSWSAMKNGP